MCSFSAHDTFPTGIAGKTVLYSIEYIMFNKHSAFCIFIPVLQLILSSTYVKLKEIAESRFTAGIWMSRVNSHMLFLAAGTTHVESAGGRSPAHARGAEREGLLSASPQAGFGAVCTVGLCQKARGEASPVRQGCEGSPSQLSALQCFTPAL